MLNTEHLQIPYPEGTDPPDGDGQMQGIAERIDSVVGGPWANYTPIWSASSGTVNIGNGSIAGRYKKIGRTLLYHVELKWGSTSTAAGAGTWYFSAPVVGLSTRVVGTVMFYGSGSKADPIGYAMKSSDQFALKLYDGTTVSGNSTPWAWATNDELAFDVVYEVGAS